MEFFDLESLIKLLVATALGALIGLEREFHGRPAGLRTNALVCLASALLIVVTRAGMLAGLNGPDNFIISVDPARVTAGIVTGIGFLGAGTILRVRDSLVRGLTTAAGIWFVAAVGVAVGLGAWTPAVVSTALALLILASLHRLELRLENAADRTVKVAADRNLAAEVEDRCRALFTGQRMRVAQRSITIDIAAGTVQLAFSVRAGRKRDASALVRDIAVLPGVTQVEWS